MTPRSRTGRRSLPLILSAFAFLTTVAVASLYLAHTLHADSAVTARGETMGTTGEIRVAGRDLGERLRNEVELEAEKRLAEIDRWMSNWNPESEVSRFNAYRGTDPFPVSYETAELVA